MDPNVVFLVQSDIRSRSKEALGVGWISWTVETKSENLFLWLRGKTSPDINRKRKPI